MCTTQQRVRDRRQACLSIQTSSLNTCTNRIWNAEQQSIEFVHRSIDICRINDCILGGVILWIHTKFGYLHKLLDSKCFRTRSTCALFFWIIFFFNYSYLWNEMKRTEFGKNLSKCSILIDLGRKKKINCIRYITVWNISQYETSFNIARDKTHILELNEPPSVFRKLYKFMLFVRW